MNDIPPWDRRNPNHPAHPAHSEYLISTQGWIAETVDDAEKVMPEQCKSDLISICQTHILERCGFITLDWDIVAVNNVHEKPEHNFYMDIEDAQQSLDYIIEETHSDVLGVWHTHPNNWPWPTPRDICGWPDINVVNWRYFVVTTSDVIEWRKVRG